MVEYLLSRKRIIRAPAEQHGVYHVLAYQRRLKTLKNEFFGRHCVTPMGKLSDWWESPLVSGVVNITTNLNKTTFDN